MSKIDSSNLWLNLIRVGTVSNDDMITVTTKTNMLPNTCHIIISLYFQCFQLCDLEFRSLLKFRWITFMRYHMKSNQFTGGSGIEVYVWNKTTNPSLLPCFWSRHGIHVSTICFYRSDLRNTYVCRHLLCIFAKYMTMLLSVFQGMCTYHEQQRNLICSIVILLRHGNVNFLRQGPQGQFHTIYLLHYIKGYSANTCVMSVSHANWVIER